MEGQDSDVQITVVNNKWYESQRMCVCKNGSVCVCVCVCVYEWTSEESER